MLLSFLVADILWFAVLPEPAGSELPPVCADSPPRYYAIDLVTTRNVPGTGLSHGIAQVQRPASSPFAVSLAEDGSYEYRITISLQRTKPPRHGHLVGWVTTPGLDQVVRLGRLDSQLMVEGPVSWNKFIVLISYESEDDPLVERWRGPVAFRGMSRSGAMHTMVGHGALQQENCAAWGY